MLRSTNPLTAVISDRWISQPPFGDSIIEAAKILIDLARGGSAFTPPATQPCASLRPSMENLDRVLASV
jgi:hypothetical protein